MQLYNCGKQTQVLAYLRPMHAGHNELSNIVFLKKLSAEGQNIFSLVKEVQVVYPKESGFIL
ncbi:hypothetical protein ACJX0J_027698, partial [Zea mays]